MNFKHQKYKKIEPIFRNNNHICNCHCHYHKKIRDNNTSNNSLLLEDNNLVINRNKKSKLNIIKTEINTNIIKSFVIYKNQIKPLFFSKIIKNPEKNVPKSKKYSYGDNKLKITTITNNHSFKEIIGRSHSKSKIFKKSRVINYVTENNVNNINYSSNNKKNIDIVKDIQKNKENIKNNLSQKELNINTNNDLSNYLTENKYDKFINDLNHKLNKKNYEKNYLLRKNETEISNANTKCQYNNLRDNLNFRYYYEYKKNLLEKKKNLIKSNSNSYMKFTKNYPPNRINANYEDLKLKIKLTLMRKCKYNNNNEINNNKKNIKYILYEKTKKILEDKNRNNYRKYKSKMDIFEDKMKKGNKTINGY